MKRMLFVFVVISALVLSYAHLKGQTHICGMQLNTDDVTFCDTFDTASADSTTRTGDLDADVWGVSRTVGQQNGPNPWPTSLVGGCSQSTTVTPPNDVRICGGRLIEAVNDAHNVIVLAMYPKQPFDFAGRTGTVSFDVTNDTQGTHAAWPEFWITDLPIPAPFTHFGSWNAIPRHGFGIRFGIVSKPGDFGLCPDGQNLTRWRMSVDSAIIIRDYVWEDTAAQELGSTPNAPPMSVQILDCVTQSDTRQPQGDATGPMNHVEIRISTTTIEVWASDAGSSTLRHIANILNPALTLTRGLVWIEDVHYNASKGLCHQHSPESSPELPECQIDHAFGWDNVAFDGPFVYRDFSYDALDNTTPGPDWPDGSASTLLGKEALINTSTSWDVLGIPANPNPTLVRLMFNFATTLIPTQINVTVNGHSHTQSWPYPDSAQATWRTDAITIPVSDLVAGMNAVTIGADQQMSVSNVNIVLVDVPGGVPVLPGSVNSYPNGWENVTGNLAGMASECGNLTLVSAVPQSAAVIAGVATQGLWSNTGGTAWTQLGQGGGSATITNRPSWLVYDAAHAGTFWESGFYDGTGAARGGVFKTTDSGSTFAQLGTVTINDYVSVDFTDSNRQTLLAGGHEQSQTVYRSTNGGSTWTNVGANLPAGTKFSSIPIALTNLIHVVNAQGYNATTEGIYRSTNGGSSWSQAYSSGPELPPLLASNGDIYWAHGSELLRSVDQGANWTAVGSGLSTITPIQLTDGTIISTSSTSLLSSTNGGVTWTAFGPTTPFSPKSVAYSSGQHAYFISQQDCNSTVMSDAVARYALNSVTPPTLRFRLR